MIPEKLEGIDPEILNPINAWSNKELFASESQKLSDLFKQNFTKYGDVVNHLEMGGPL